MRERKRKKISEKLPLAYYYLLLCASAVCIIYHNTYLIDLVAFALIVTATIVKVAVVFETLVSCLPEM